MGETYCWVLNEKGPPSLDVLVLQVEALVLKIGKLADRICAFRDDADTAIEFLLQLEYKRTAQYAKEEVLQHQFELY